MLPVSANTEPMASGKFEPTWASLAQYQTPEWFRDAKFGIWAHWGPQCQPEFGDWYARLLYMQHRMLPWQADGETPYQNHIRRYGHPSKTGFIDIIGQWSDAAESDGHIAWVRAIWSSLEPNLLGSVYINHMMGDDRPERVRASYGDNYTRLRELKTVYDPTNLFRMNANIVPGS